MQTPGQGEQMLAAANMDATARAAVATAIGINEPSTIPSLGRIVLLVTPAGLAPAVVTAVWTRSTINVSAFLDGQAHVYPCTSAVYDATRELPGTWSWPDRV